MTPCLTNRMLTTRLELVRPACGHGPGYSKYPVSTVSTTSAWIRVGSDRKVTPAFDTKALVP